MVLVIFSWICIYFLIGMLFVKLTGSDRHTDEIDSVLWFIFWPLVLATIVAMFIAALVVRILLTIYYLCRALFKGV